MHTACYIFGGRIGVMVFVMHGSNSVPSHLLPPWFSCFAPGSVGGSGSSWGIPTATTISATNTTPPAFLPFPGDFLGWVCGPNTETNSAS